jgi:hypothetical protein
VYNCLNTTLEGEYEMSDNTTIKLVLHYLNRNNVDAATSFSVNSTNEYLSQIANSGYDLISTHYVGEGGDGLDKGFGVLYIFAKRQPMTAKKAKEVSLED